MTREGFYVNLDRSGPLATGGSPPLRYFVISEGATSLRPTPIQVELQRRLWLASDYRGFPSLCPRGPSPLGTSRTKHVIKILPHHQRLFRIEARRMAFCCPPGKQTGLSSAFGCSFAIFHRISATGWRLSSTVCLISRICWETRGPKALKTIFLYEFSPNRNWNNT